MEVKSIQLFSKDLVQFLGSAHGQGENEASRECFDFRYQLGTNYNKGRQVFHVKV